MNENEAKLLLGLCSELYDDNPRILQVKINKYLEDITGAECAFIFVVSEDEDVLLCQVISNRILAEELKFPEKNNSFSTALTLKRTIDLSDIKAHHRDDVNKLSGIVAKSLMCIPICNENKHIVLMACLVNKGSSDDFTTKDQDSTVSCFKHIVPCLLKALAYEKEKRLRIQCQSLLTVAKNLFTHLDDVTLLLKEIMQEARNLTKAERCSLFLIDKESNELVAKVFDGDLPDDGTKTAAEVRIPSNQGIAGHVFTLGELLNIKDAYSHPLFYRGIDESTGFKTRNILCFPIKDDKGVIGVAELCNKIKGLCFTTFDEEIATAFSIYCGISIMHSLMWKKVRDAQYRSKLSNELMMYHMKIMTDDVTRIVSAKIPKVADIHPEFCEYQFFPRGISTENMPLAVMAMFEDLGMISRWRISKEPLSRFILMVRRGYRDPPYHNWSHAFSVAHFGYLLLKNLNLLQEHLSDIEGLALLVACLCHDLDHRGTTNSFQVASKSVLAALYSSEGSVMERHHLSQAMAIINTEGCNIFEELTQEEYTVCLDSIRDVIVATDLANHLRIIPDLRKMIKTGYNKDDKKHHHLLLSLLMTSCDLSDQTKNWKECKKIAEMVYREFFSQGDLEKAMGNRPLEMMDRDRACIPELQISFITEIVEPVYSLLSQQFPQSRIVFDNVLVNKMYWEKMRDLYKRRNTVSSLDIFHDEELDKEVLTSVQRK